MPSAFDSTPDEVGELLRAAAEEAAAYYGRIAELPIMPDVTAASVRRCLDASLPVAGTPAAELLRVFSDALVPLSRHNGHPRFFGYVASPGTAIAAAGDLLAA